MNNHTQPTQAPYTPTLEQIRAECRKIQAGWTPAQEQSRLAESNRRQEWLVPQMGHGTGRVEKREMR